MKFKDLFNDGWSVNWENIEKLSWFEKLKSTQQSSVWHKEGDVYKHIRLVTEAMENILRMNGIYPGDTEWIMCMSAAICHDLGKGETTKWSDEKKDWSTKNHGVVGERITRNLFHDEDIVLREKVCYMVRHHMTLHHVFDEGKDSDKILKRLSHGIVPVKFMMMLNEADSRGSINDIETKEMICDKHNKLLEKCYTLCCYAKPYDFVEKSQLIRDFIDYQGEVVNDTNDFCVYIMCGFPGCGKSTYIKNNLSDKKIISRDIIRCELGIGGATIENDKKVVGTREEEDKVSEIFNKKMIEYCENKESFVLDNTNLKYQYRKDYLKKVMKYNPKVKIIYIEAPDFIKDCRKRRNGEISKEVYKRMNDNFDFPQLYECNELVIVKQDDFNGNQEFSFNSDFIPTNKIPRDTQILNDLKITRGAMILDGYDCYDSCIKYMDELIEKYDKI